MSAFRRLPHGLIWKLGAALIAIPLLALPGGCPPQQPPDNSGIYNNVSDATNNNARFIGSEACLACHSDFRDSFATHGHSQALKLVEGDLPEFPNVAPGVVGSVLPPDGFDWTQIAYVVGGYLRGAHFVGLDGFLLTTGVTGADTAYSLGVPPAGIPQGFYPFQPTAADPQPFGFDCFRCHAVNPQPPTAPALAEDNRLGVNGTWFEAGVGCEACHGPGGNHAPNPAARNLYVNIGPSACSTCHVADPDNPALILVQDSLFNGYQQWSELRASGGHASFSCNLCHDPHASTFYEAGVRNTCRTCHVDTNMALHQDVVFVRGDYTEEVTCESCHMTWAGKVAADAPDATVGPFARVGDVRSHLFGIRTDVNVIEEVVPGGNGVYPVGEDGQARLTVDSVCLRCHNGIGNAFNLALPPLGNPAATASQLHTRAAQGQ